MNMLTKGLLIGGLGLGALVVGVLATKKAKIKATEIIKESKANEEIIEECYEKYAEEYTFEDRKEDLKVNKIQTTIRIVKAYILPYVTTVIGGCMFTNGLFKLYKYRKMEGLLNE